MRIAKIQRQRWNGYDKYVIWAEHGSVQLNIWEKPFGIKPKIKAFLHLLWVDEDARKRGIGKQLMGMAEQIARERGCKTIHLEWVKGDTPQWVRDWYVRNGYSGLKFGEYNALMEKKL